MMAVRALELGGDYCTQTHWSCHSGCTGVVTPDALDLSLGRGRAHCTHGRATLETGVAAS